MTDVQDEKEPLESMVEGDSDKTDYLEFLGTDPTGFGTQFYGATGTHSISNSHMKAVHDVELGKKEVTWKRGANDRFLVPTEGLNPAAVEILAADPMFKLVSL